MTDHYVHGISTLMAALRNSDFLSIGDSLRFESTEDQLYLNAKMGFKKSAPY